MTGVTFQDYYAMRAEMDDLRDKALSHVIGSGETPPGGWDDDTWRDQSIFRTGLYDRTITSAYLPLGVYAFYVAFQWRIQSPFPDDTKARIRRDISRCVHLHGKHKRELLKGLRKASVRWGVAGVRMADDRFCHRIWALKRPDAPRSEAVKIRQDLLRHTCIPEPMRENLLFNLASYEAAIWGDHGEQA